MTNENNTVTLLNGVCPTCHKCPTCGATSYYYYYFNYPQYPAYPLQPYVYPMNPYNQQTWVNCADKGDNNLSLTTTTGTNNV